MSRLNYLFGSTHIACFRKKAAKVVLIDAIYKQAKGFYLHYGFIEVPGYDKKLFLAIETIEQLLSD